MGHLLPRGHRPPWHVLPSCGHGSSVSVQVNISHPWWEPAMEKQMTLILPPNLNHVNINPQLVFMFYIWANLAVNVSIIFHFGGIIGWIFSHVLSFYAPVFVFILNDESLIYILFLHYLLCYICRYNLRLCFFLSFWFQHKAVLCFFCNLCAAGILARAAGFLISAIHFRG